MTKLFKKLFKNIHGDDLKLITADIAFKFRFLFYCGHASPVMPKCQTVSGRRRKKGHIFNVAGTPEQWN